MKKIIPIVSEQSHGALAKLNWSTLSDLRAGSPKDGKSIHRAAFIVTGACNFKCPYCNELGGSRAPTMRKGYAESLLRSLAQIGLKELRISGGEPTLVPWLPELVRLAKSLGVRCAVSTNGFSDLAVYQSLIDAGAAEFSVSLDSADPAVADLQSGNQTGVLEKVSASIRLMAANHIPVYVGMACGAGKSPEEIRKTLALARQLGASEIKIMSLAQEGAPVDTSWITPELRQSFPLLNWRCQNFEAGRDNRGLAPGDARRCRLAQDDATIAGGMHYPCNVYFREKGEPIGAAGPDMMAQRMAWSLGHDPLEDPICRRYCMDILREYNNRAEELSNAQNSANPAGLGETP